MKKYILVCDDDAGIVDVASIILEEKGYEVATVSRGEDVIQAIKGRLPDLILLDLWMPGITGDKITRRLKSSHKTKNIPIIIFSANRDTEEIARNAGANGFICKPFDITDLENIIAKILEI